MYLFHTENVKRKSKLKRRKCIEFLKWRLSSRGCTDKSSKAKGNLMADEMHKPENVFTCCCHVKLVFLHHQEEITVEIKINLSILPQSIFQRQMTHVFGLVLTFTPWKKSFYIEEGKDYAMLCEVRYSKVTCSLKFMQRFIKEKKAEVWDLFQNILKVIDYVIRFLFRFFEAPSTRIRIFLKTQLFLSV